MTKAFSKRRRYLALWFPYLATDRLRIMAAQRSDISPKTRPNAPLVLYAKSGNAQRLTAGDAHAARAGLSAGISLADARARFGCDTLVIKPIAVQKIELKP